MGRNPGSTSARRGLGGALLLALCVAGCDANYIVRATSGGTPSLPSAPPPGGSVNVYGTSSFGALLGIGLFGAASYGGAFYVPPMDPNRRVVEQDCTRPIEDPTANLRCR